MVNYMSMMLQVAKLVGEVEELSMQKACTYAPRRVQIVGKTKDGEEFKIEFEVGERLHDS